MIFSLIALTAAVIGPPVRKDSVRYRNGSVELSATLLRPARAGRMPALVILHGSGSSDRSNEWTSAYANALAEQGIAVLYPDKRGSGKSGGSWKTASFEDLAADASAGIALLRARKDIDTTRIGVIGFSQGGYVAPVVAATDPACKLVIVISGGVATLLDQTVDEIVTEAAKSPTPLSATEEATLRRLYRQGYEVTRTGQGWTAFSAALDSAGKSGTALAAAAGTIPPDSSHWAWRWIRTTGNFDPIAYWKRVRQPTLFFYGGQDHLVRTRQSMERFWETVGADAPNFVFTMLQGNGHGLFRADEMAFIQRWVSSRGAN